ncbi:hypothetical protein [Streptococcus sp. 21WXBC0057M1]|uniref:Uncharacterized protein n=1 Tax=Streptococcus wuxiensis TaxID=3095078 RepID=A0ABU5FYH3_9STRE|nr:hypothetical protein [Streptococcus sp. 21WXBC0057M1]MDY4338146.1 hypothetical protein [Streptococcus sp. 21WXBC0057M1]DAS44313.1 MAG TPA: hypothetical protein [Caudoviricetes sp.]DAY16318.1 MAG TPA: hypothetical protein [Caudoviricetes sp.]
MIEVILASFLVSFVVSHTMMKWHSLQVNAMLEKYLFETDLLYKKTASETLELIQQHKRQ